MEIIENKALGFKLDYVKIKENYYFPAKMIAKQLGYKDCKDAIKQHVDKNDKIQVAELLKNPVGGAVPPTLKSQPNTQLLSLPGLLDLVTGSDLSIGKQYRKWVNHEVVPSIIFTNQYTMKKPFAYIELPSKINLNCERDYRIKLITYLRFYREKFLNHLMFTGSMGELLSGENYDIRKEATMTGYEKGSWDVIISTPSKYYNGCYIELKYGDNQLSPEQKYSIQQYKQNNHKIIVAREWTKLQRLTDKYLRYVRIPCPKCNLPFKSNRTLAIHMKCFHHG